MRTLALTHRTHPLLRGTAMLLLLSVAVLPAAWADDPPGAGAAPVATPGEDDVDKYSADELLELVGPIALYPDGLIASILPATTVPLDLVQAARWLKEQGGSVDEIPEDKGWDESVLALLQFPDVLEWMNDNLDWVEQMGFAVNVQQGDVLAAIQAFRSKAQAAGNLETNEYQEVDTETKDGTEVIVIQPASPEIIYVPTYNPVTVVHPVYTTQTSPAVAFGVGVAVGVVGAWAWHNIAWGWGHGWRGGSINVSRNVNVWTGGR
ncbi:MAG: DUF3300 domain-containing protein, partial [Planctomycetota bacterium]